MPDAVERARDSFILHRIALMRFCLFSLSSLCFSIQTALVGMSWHEANNQIRFLVIVSIAGTWTTTMIAFFDKTLSKIAAGKDPFIAIEDPPGPGQTAVAVSRSA